MVGYVESSDLDEVIDKLNELVDEVNKIEKQLNQMDPSFDKKHVKKLKHKK